MPDINFKITYHLGDDYDNIRYRANKYLRNYIDYPDLISFDEGDRSVTFTTEQLIPTFSINRPRVMLLFSNPHPHSIRKKMFLSPNLNGRENLFWATMRETGWITFKDTILNPLQLAEHCLQVNYEGPFDLIFYCYYSFPTSFPGDIPKIFGKDYFEQKIEPEARNEFQNTIHRATIKAVVAFNKDIFNHVANDSINRYINRLKNGEVIQSQIKGIDKTVPIFLTFPTGWRYDKQYRLYRKKSLEAIKTNLIRLL